MLFSLQSLHAHPHSWVSLTSDFVINTDGNLAELRQRWVFDPFYSALTTADLRTDYGDNLRIGLDIHGELIIDNLEAQNYFSHMLYQEQDNGLTRPVDHKLSVISIEDDEILVLEMTFDLASESISAQKSFQFSVYDPTYYVDMRHESESFIRLHNQSSLECGFEILDANPSEEQIEYASSLDKTETDTVGLGEVFAQYVEVTCL